MNNNFPEGTHELFQQAWKCWYCESNRADSIHHIVGRGEDEKTESSILNAAPMCNHKCHLAHHGELRTDEMTGQMLKKTYEYLQSIGYEFNEIDGKFMDKYLEYYI